MKTIGLIGGLSWHSTLTYYRLINERVADQLGGLRSARCVLYSFDLAEMHALQERGAWDEVARHVIAAGRAVAQAGAAFLVLCANTTHRVAEQVQAAVTVPLLHSADATGERIQARGLHTVGLLGTRFTMEDDFWKARLADRGGLDVVVPGEAERAAIHAVICAELCRGLVREASRQRCVNIIRELARAGCEGIVLGCTELGLLIRPEDSPVPLFDATAIHAEAAADFALG